MYFFLAFTLSLISYSEKFFIALILIYSLLDRKLFVVHFLTLPLILIDLLTLSIFGKVLVRVIENYFYIFIVLSFLMRRNLFIVPERHLHVSFFLLFVLATGRIIDILFLQTGWTAILNQNSLALAALMHIYLLPRSTKLSYFVLLLNFAVASKMAFISSFLWTLIVTNQKKVIYIVIVGLVCGVFSLLQPQMNVISEFLSDSSASRYLSGRIILWEELWNLYDYPSNWRLFLVSNFTNPENFFITFCLTSSVIGPFLLSFFIFKCSLRLKYIILFLLPCLVYPFVLPLFLAMITKTKET